MFNSNNLLTAVLVNTQGQTFPLTKRHNILGRANVCHIILKVINVLTTQHPSVSKEHALIEFDDSGNVILKDLDSVNGCVVNDTKIKRGSQITLCDQDYIMIGKGVMMFYNYSLRSKPISDKIRGEFSRTKRTDLSGE